MTPSEIAARHVDVEDSLSLHLQRLADERASHDDVLAGLDIMHGIAAVRGGLGLMLAGGLTRNGRMDGDQKIRHRLVVACHASGQSGSGWEIEIDRDVRIGGHLDRLRYLSRAVDIRRDTQRARRNVVQFELTMIVDAVLGPQNLRVTAHCDGHSIEQLRTYACHRATERST